VIPFLSGVNAYAGERDQIHSELSKITSDRSVRTCKSDVSQDIPIELARESQTSGNATHYFGNQLEDRLSDNLHVVVKKLTPLRSSKFGVMVFKVRTAISYLEQDESVNKIAILKRTVLHCPHRW
jgi:hypothetical protein